MKVVMYPDPILNRPCDDVTVFDLELKRLADDMAETMYASRGAGLAAPQVGLSRRFILIDPTAGESANGLIALANPTITWLSDELISGEEGCLSLPGIFLPIARSVACDVEYFDLSGTMKSMRCIDWQARIVQHETEHLLGITMLNKVGSFARKLALKNLAPNG